MHEQLDISSLMQQQEEEKYCFDDDTNEMRNRLIEIADKYGISIERDEFTIWSHVPQYGYRMNLGMKVTKEDFGNEDFQKDIDDVVEIAKQREIELSPMWGAVFFFREDEVATLSFYTTFIDKKRQKIK
jgi:hypothetical protein